MEATASVPSVLAAIEFAMKMIPGCSVDCAMQAPDVTAMIELRQSLIDMQVDGKATKRKH